MQAAGGVEGADREEHAGSQLKPGSPGLIEEQTEQVRARGPQSGL